MWSAVQTTPAMATACDTLTHVGFTPNEPGAHMTTTALVDLLAEHKSLGAAPPEELAWLAAHGSLRELDTGAVLTPKGARVEGLFVLLSGRIAMSVDRGAGLHKIMEWRAG